MPVLYSDTPDGTYTDSPVPDGTTSLWRVRAVSATGESDPSGTVSVAGTPLPVPVRSWPDVRLEIDTSPNADARTPPTAWTSLTTQGNHLLAVSIRRGQSAPYEPVEPGEMVVRLSNTNGFLDTRNTASPFAAYLTHGRQMRLVHRRSDNTDQVVFQGNVQRWPNAAANVPGGTASVELIVLDAIAGLGAALLPGSLIEYELERGARYPRPAHLFPLREDGAGPDITYASSTSDYVVTPRVVGAPRSGASEMVPFSDIGGIRCDTQLESLTLPASAMPEAPWTISAVVVIPEGGSLLNAWGETTVNFQLGQVTGGAGARGRVKLTDNTVQTISGGVINDGVPHLISLAVTTSSAVLFVDGTAVDSLALTSPPASGGTVIIAQGTGCSQALTMAWASYVGSTQQALMNLDLKRPWHSQTTDTRLAALLDIVAPTAARTLATSSFLMLPVTMQSKPALDVMRRTVRAADGALWADRTNRIRFAVRPIGAMPAPLRTYGGGGVPIIEAIPSRDENADRVTRCVATNEVGTQVEYHDTNASKSGEARLELEGMTTKDPLDLYYLCERTVYYRRTVTPYIESVVLDAKAAGYDDTLALDLYDPAAVAHRPGWSASTLTEQAQVIGVDHEADAESEVPWTTTLRLRPPRTPRLMMAVPSGGTGASTPDSAASSITGDLDLRAWVQRNDWTATTTGALVDKNGAYRLTSQSGKVSFTWTNSGGASSTLTAPLPRGRSRFARVRATLVVATGDAKLYVSEDGYEWRLLNEQTFGATSIRDTTTDVEIGYRTSGASTFPLVGNVFDAEARAGIDGPVRWRFDPTADAGAVGATSWTASTGEVWSVRSGSAVEAF